jgi:lipopolysaccharide/colanic/teichoic acid biosynthesis glycosyltransferase
MAAAGGTEAGRSRGLYARRGKRLFDLWAALALLVVLSPLLAVLAVLVIVTAGRPVLFRQRRPGRDGEIFTLFKLRTMREAGDGSGRALPDAERLTRLGRLLRAASLDELPELWNVVRGEMSLVGPRPLLVEYLDRYSARQRRRHEVRPGITGWAQVNGRNALTWERKFELDVWYVEHLSFALDLRILALTGWRVVRGEGISAHGHATMPDFQGSSEAE